MVKSGFCSFAALFHTNSNDWAKKAMLLPDLEQRVRAMIGIILSNQQAHGRRSSAIRQPCCCRKGCIVIQMSEYLLNNYRVFDTENNLDETGTFATFISLLEGPQLAELRTKHARNQATDWFCFPLTTGTCGIQGGHFRDRPRADIEGDAGRR